MAGTNGSIFAIGDCTASSYAPTAQVASQQGAYLARIFSQMAKQEALEKRLAILESEVGFVPVGVTNDGAVVDGRAEEGKKMIEAEAERLRNQLGKINLKPFHYSHQGSLAYVHHDLSAPSSLIITIFLGTLDQTRLSRTCPF
jgi:NADH:ubiquinone reductase (non-electrogenic)